MTKGVDVFREELHPISSPRRRELVEAFFNEAVPDYFWEIAASSSGKYHSGFDCCEGGLVKHTKMTVAVANEMHRLEKYLGVNMDVVIAALLIHDTFKNGESGRHPHADHPQIAARKFLEFAEEKGYEDMNFVRRVHNCVYMHMGQWTTKAALAAAPNCVPSQPDAEIELVHLSDYISSRKFFDLARKENV